MPELVVYHNPRCSKSRSALDILRAEGADIEIIEYLTNPPDRATLERILDAIPDPPSELVRRDPKFKELGLTRDDVDSREAVVELLSQHPELMQRPVVLRGDRAVIARPPERVAEVLE